jgi:quercetin dioxygenase-like cupin family protein
LGPFWFNQSSRFGAKTRKEASEMQTILIIGSILFFLFSGQAFAQPIAKHLLDAKPPEALLFDAEKWFQDHPIKEGNAVSETIFLSPRAQVVFIRGKGMVLGRHIHTQVDELVYIYKGRGEYYINGKWVPAKAGQFHTCPRGVAHSSRAAEGEELWLICFFTDPLPPLGDRVMIDDK